ncbi:MAG: hypothetical protein ACTSQ4_07655 [Candidatus Heimdallarchaeaceae archaeon]
MGKKEFKCVFCGYKGEKIAEMKDFGLWFGEGVLPEDAKIVICPTCDKSHVTNGETIYVKDTKEKGSMIDNFVTKMREIGEM